MDLKGQKMLKVCSILMIIGGALLLLISIIGLLGVIAAASLGTDLGMSMGTAYATMALAIVSGVIELAAGIIGVQAAKMPSVGKIKASFIMGLLVVVLSLVSSIMSIVMNGFVASDIINILVGLVVPVLYIVGVNQYKNALLELMGGAE